MACLALGTALNAGAHMLPVGVLYAAFSIILESCFQRRKEVVVFKVIFQMLLIWKDIVPP